MKKILAIILLMVCVACSLTIVSCKDKQAKSCSYDITCSFDGTKIRGSEVFTFYNSTDNSFKELKFNLFMNAYRKDAKFSPISKANHSKCYYAGESYGGIEIESVIQNDNKVQFEITGEDKNVLTVYLENEVFPNEQTQVKITFVSTIPKVISRTGITESTVNLGNFYPILCGITDGGFYECKYYSIGDPFFSDIANYNVKITLDSKYIVASSGKLVAMSNIDNNKMLCYSAENLRSFCLVLSKDFESVVDTSLGVEVNYYYIKDKEPNKSLSLAVQSLKTFSELFGEYPYSTYSVVETPFNEGGMEYSALVYISSDLEREAYNEVIVHETAHQWWQVVVGNNEIEYGFLDEGLAEYSVVLFYENNPKYNITRESLISSCEKTYRVYCSVFDKLYKQVDTSMLRSLDKYKSDYEYVNIAYVKGCLLQDYLRSSIGDTKYFKGLKNYYKEYSFQNATPFDLAGEFDKLGADTNGFFDSFFSGKVII